MSETIVVLTEKAIGDVDAANILGLHPGETVDVHLVLPARAGRHLLVDLIDRLSLFELPERPDEHGGDAGRRPEQALAESIAALEAAGLSATGEVAAEKPVDALIHAVRERGAREAVVVTVPHAVEDTFHTDWATRAQDALGLPVLHLYAGSTFIGDS